MKMVLIGIAVSVAIIMGGAASSWAQSFHALANCKQDVTNPHYNGTLGITSDSQLYDSDSGDNGVQVICQYNVGATATIVSGWAAGANTITAQLCYQPYGGGGAVCFATGGSTVAGLNHFAVTVPSPPIASNPGAQDFVFLRIQMFDSGGTVWGYTGP
jgi:hypothetical protein